MEGAKTVESLKEFNPLIILRYSATHKQEHNKIYRLDALDAYNQKLVKKIAVRGISREGPGRNERATCICNPSKSPTTSRLWRGWRWRFRQSDGHQAGYCARLGQG